MDIIPLDLNFQRTPGAIASFLIPHRQGAVLIESGPGSTVGALSQHLARHGFAPGDITDLLVTHIHLDHAGAAGWVARHGARVHVHPFGLPHLQNPERLLASASRIYGDRMDALWGEMLPVPASQLHPVHDGATLEIHGLVFRAIETPGHATHHHAYLLGDTCFTGDIGGVRLAGPPYLMLPMPPPEFHLEAWQASLARLRSCAIRRVAPTHFGIYDDAAAHWDMLGAALADVETWLLENMPRNPTLEEMQTLIPQWYAARARAHGLQSGLGAAHETANPAWMSAAGLHRYWQKFRHNM